jgi:hypothetical protein
MSIEREARTSAGPDAERALVREIELVFTDPDTRLSDGADRALRYVVDALTREARTAAPAPTERKQLAEINGMAEEAKRLVYVFGRERRSCKPAKEERTALHAAIDALRDAAIAGVTDPAVHPAGTSLDELTLFEAWRGSQDDAFPIDDALRERDWRVWQGARSLGNPAVPSLELHAAEAGSSSAVNSGSEHPAVPDAGVARDLSGRSTTHAINAAIGFAAAYLNRALPGQITAEIAQGMLDAVTGRTHEGAVPAAGASKLDDQKPSVNPAP